MRLRFFLFMFLVGTSLTTLSSRAAELKPDSVKAWDSFVASREAELRQCDNNMEALLRLQISPQDAERLRAGEIIVRPAAKKGAITVPFAQIHDWIGTVFIPNTSIDAILAEARNYNGYRDIYHPSVVEGKLLERQPDLDEYSLVMRQDVLSIKTGLEGKYRSEYHEVDPRHWYSVTRSERIQEITNFGGTDQKEDPPDCGNGFVWRLYSSTKYEESDNGVYVELEAAVLSRPVPHSLSWLVNPIVEKISRAALTMTLRQTRAAKPSQDLAWR